MVLASGLLWYMVIFEPDGGLVSMPSQFETNDDCEAAISEFPTTNPSLTWELQCIGPDDQ